MVRPLIADFPYVKNYTGDTVDTVMYGDAIKVDFVYDADVATKEVILPQYSLWINLINFDLVAPTTQGGTTVLVTASLNYPIMLQKEGTIVPW